MPGLGLRHALDLVEGDVHAPELLQEELARTGGAFVARVNALNAAVVIEMVDHEGLPARTDDDAIGVRARKRVGNGPFDRFGFGYGR